MSQVSSQSERETEAESPSLTGVPSLSPQDRGSFYHAKRGQGTLIGLEPGLGGEGTEGLAFLQDVPLQGQGGKAPLGCGHEEPGTSKREAIQGRGEDPGRRLLGAGESQKGKAAKD